MTGAATDLLAMAGVSKRFGELTAVRDVSFGVRPGEIHALVGENGAGKSTLMSLAYGLHQPDAGTLLVDGRVVAVSSPADALRLGIGMVPQHFKLAPSFTVAENIVLGAEPLAGWMRLDRAASTRRAKDLGQRFGLELDPGARVADLPVGLQQRVEILKALHRQVRLLILDEPTAVLTPHETRELFNTMRALAAAGTSIIFITHKLREVIAVAHRVSVMRQGKIIATRPNQDLAPADLARLMVGRAVLLRVAKTAATPKAHPALRVTELTALGERGEVAVRKVSFAVRPGEIVGIAGVQGNGQDELVQAIGCFRTPTAGRIEIAGFDVAGHSPIVARQAGLAYVPADRQRVGLSPTSAVWVNTTLGRHRTAALSRGPLLRITAACQRAADLIRQFDVRGANPDTPARALSGGNQQKIVLARELSGDARLIVVEQPSQGVDIGAIEAIHRLLVQMRDAGRAVLLISADLDEVLALSDRVLVMYRGEIAGEIEASAADAETVGALMGGLGQATREAAHVG